MLWPLAIFLTRCDRGTRNDGKVWQANNQENAILWGGVILSVWLYDSRVGR